MSNTFDSREYDTFARVHLVAQPLSLGTILLAIGGYFGYHMIAAYSFSEPWWLQLGNLLLIAGFAALFAWGMSNMLSLFQRVHICDGELKLTMFGKVLLQLKESDIRSIRSLCRETTLRNKEVQYYRMYITYRGKKERKLWVDWTIAKEESLREHLPNTLFLM
jgi:hypothetical protein